MAFKRPSDHLWKEQKDQEVVASPSRKKRIRLCGVGASCYTNDNNTSSDDDDDEEPLSQVCVSASSSSSDDDDLEEAESLQEEHQEPSHDESSDDDDDDDEYSVVPKHVRFATASGGSAGDDAVLTRVGPAPRHPRLAKPQGWWNRQDRTSFLQDCRDHLEEFQEDYPDRVLHFERVRLQCLRAGNGTSQDDNDEEDDYPPLVLPGTVRGLEWGLWSSSQQRSNSNNRRQSHVQAVLDLQEELWDQQEDEGPNGSVDNDRLTTLLRCKAERSSRGHRLLARLLAKGDEVQNIGINTRSANNKKPTTTMVHHRPSIMTPCQQGYQRPQHRIFRSRCTIMPHPN